MNEFRTDGFFVEYKIDKKTGVVVHELWSNERGYTRYDGPCEIWRHPDTGETRSETWKIDGKKHRDGDLPAQWSRSRSGIITQEIYCLRGRRHRDGKPALIERDNDTGAVTRAGWYQHGDLFRPEGGPALVIVDPGTGVAMREEYRLYGMLHREDGPALIERDAQSGRIVAQAYFLEDDEQKPFSQGLEGPEPRGNN